MDLSFTPLQEELRAQARSFLDATPEPAWRQLAELGWTGASVAEEHGGAGLTFLEEAVLHEESGRALLHAPLWSTSSLLPFLPSDDQAAVAAGADTVERCYYPSRGETAESKRASIAANIAATACSVVGGGLMTKWVCCEEP